MRRWLCMGLFFLLGNGSAAAVSRLANLPSALVESSGLVWVKGRLWTMADHHNRRLYALSPKTGKVIKSILLQGVVNRDWESLAADKRYFYVGDIGNNSGKRKYLTIYRFGINKLKRRRVHVLRKIQFRYPHYHPKHNRHWYHDFDAEAMISWGKYLLIFTKNWRSGNTTVYQVPNRPGRYTARKLKTFQLKGMVTAADHTQKTLYLLSYPIPLLGFHVFTSTTSMQSLISVKVSQLNSRQLPFRCQAEGLAVQGKYMWVTCEGRLAGTTGQLYRLII